MNKETRAYRLLSRHQLDDLAPVRYIYNARRILESCDLERRGQSIPLLFVGRNRDEHRGTVSCLGQHFARF